MSTLFTIFGERPTQLHWFTSMSYPSDPTKHTALWCDVANIIFCINCINTIQFCHSPFTSHKLTHHMSKLINSSFLGVFLQCAFFLQICDWVNIIMGWWFNCGAVITVIGLPSSGHSLLFYCYTWRSGSWCKFVRWRPALVWLELWLRGRR